MCRSLRATRSAGETMSRAQNEPCGHNDLGVNFIVSTLHCMLHDLFPCFSRKSACKPFASIPRDVVYPVAGSPSYKFHRSWDLSDLLQGISTIAGIDSPLAPPPPSHLGKSFSGEFKYDLSYFSESWQEHIPTRYLLCAGYFQANYDQLEDIPAPRGCPQKRILKGPPLLLVG